MFSDTGIDEEFTEEIRKSWLDAIERKKEHPERLHDELWFNEPDEVGVLHEEGKWAMSQWNLFIDCCVHVVFR